MVFILTCAFSLTSYFLSVTVGHALICVIGMPTAALTVLPAVLTLVAAVLELGVVVILVPNDDSDATDADERLVGLIGGGDRQRELPVALAVKARRGGNHTCREEVCIEEGGREPTGACSPRRHGNSPVSGSISKPDDMPSRCMMPYLTSPLTPMSASWAWTRRTKVPAGWFSRTTAF